MSKIVLEHIDKFYGDNHVLRDINLTIEDGDFMTLLGPSGCGKTTTLRVVSGLLVEFPCIEAFKKIASCIIKYAWLNNIYATYGCLFVFHIGCKGSIFFSFRHIFKFLLFASLKK